MKNSFSFCILSYANNNTKTHGEAIMSITQFTPAIQTKLWQYMQTFKDKFTKPEHKFIHQMVFGILKGGSVQLNTIARNLQENIPLKKVSMRLGAHMDKKNLWYTITQSTLKAQQHRLKSCRFIILDLSDIQKEYAKKMPGLYNVHDGSKDIIGPGYWQCNITAVSEDGATLIPLYSELYSQSEEDTSQNIKIIEALKLVMKYAAEDAVIVIDRGADRKILYDSFLQSGYKFIIRQVGNRNLFNGEEVLNFKEISRNVKLKWSFKVERIKKNKVQYLSYKGGAKKVQLKENGPLLWLVVMKEANRGYSWYLLNLPECDDARSAVEAVVKGYGLRWKIEEVHRQIKSDYQLESIRLQRYEALKTMNSLLWMAISFLYTRLESFVMDILFEPELAIINRKKMKDLFRFIYYKLAFAVKRILSLAKLRHKIDTIDRDYGQLSLHFEYGI